MFTNLLNYLFTFFQVNKRSAQEVTSEVTDVDSRIIPGVNERIFCTNNNNNGGYNGGGGFGGFGGKLMALIKLISLDNRHKFIIL